MIILLTLLYSVLASTGILDQLIYGESTTPAPIKRVNKPPLRSLKKDVPKQKNYVTTSIDKCPTEGYFFKNDLPSALPGTCYLCFCRNNDSAVCWPRDNRRCDKEHYKRHGPGKREQRLRRSPGLTDFFRDAARDTFTSAKQTVEECKPHEASYSIGCPPADWCIGCTVCDCDATGHWDCHLLSFCTEEDKKRHLKAKGKIYVRGKKENAKDARLAKITRRQMAVKEIAKQMAAKAKQPRKSQVRRKNELSERVKKSKQQEQRQKQQRQQQIQREKEEREEARKRQIEREKQQKEREKQQEKREIEKRQQHQKQVQRQREKQQKREKEQREQQQKIQQQKRLKHQQKLLTPIIPPDASPEPPPLSTTPATKSTKVENKAGKKVKKDTKKAQVNGKPGNSKKTDAPIKQNMQRKRAITRKNPVTHTTHKPPNKAPIRRSSTNQKPGKKANKQNKKPKAQSDHSDSDKESKKENKIKNTVKKPNRRQLESEEELYEIEEPETTTKPVNNKKPQVKSKTNAPTLTAQDLKNIQAEIQNNYQKKILSAVQKMIEAQLSRSEGSRKKRSAPVFKKVVVQKSVEDDISIRKMHNYSRPLLTVPFNGKRNGKINVDRTNKVKLHRHKRNPAPFSELPNTRNDLENEIATNSVKLIPNAITERPHSFTHSMYNYYKYFTDNNIINATSLHDEFLTELIHMKNTTAKRSIDNQLSVIPKLTVLKLIDKVNETFVVDHALIDKNNANNATNKSETSTSKAQLEKVKVENTVILQEHTTENLTDIDNIVVSSSTERHSTTNTPTVNREDKKHTVLDNATESITVQSLLTPVVSKHSELTTGKYVTEYVTAKETYIDFVTSTTTKNLKEIHSTPSRETLLPPTKAIWVEISSNNTTETSKVTQDINQTESVNTPYHRVTTPGYDLNYNKIVTEKPKLHTQNNIIKVPEVKHLSSTEHSFKYNIRSTTVKHNMPKLKKKRKHYRPRKPNVATNTKKGLVTKNITSVTTVKPKPRDEQVLFVLKTTPEPFQRNVTEAKNDTFLNIVEHNETKLNNWIEDKTSTKKEFMLAPNTFQHTNFTKEKLNDSISKIQDKSNTSLPTYWKKKVNSHDIKMIGILHKKHKIKKVIPTLYNKGNKEHNYFQRENQNITDHDGLKNFFRKLINNFDMKKGPKQRTKANRFKILRYLQKFFQKIFSNGKHKKNKTTTPDFNKRNVIETLCATFGPCHINAKHKVKLQAQIDHLNTETYNMLRSIKIIKGLLKLIDIAKNDRKLKGVKTNKTKFKTDIQKLHAILRDTYVDEEHLDKLTDTQKTQIEYIKNSTQSFVQSAAKFTLVLNDIINIITVPTYKSQHIKDEHQTSFPNKHPNFEKVENIRETQLNNTLNLNETGELSLKKLKELVSKYSVIQNSFMRKIYTVLANMHGREVPLPETYPTKLTKTEHNKTEAIQVYTKNIIHNLRKLKNLAQVLNGSARKKRDLRDDDSIEYLLTLMEYLLKQNHPSDIGPANDGIDLLIEAIKNAPDIKISKKKLRTFKKFKFPRKNIPKINKKSMMRNITAKAPTIDFAERNNSKEDSASDYNKISREENYTSIIDDSKYNAMERSLDEDADVEEKFIFNKMKQAYSTFRPVEEVTEAKIFTEPLLYTKVYMVTLPSTLESTYSTAEPTRKKYVSKIFTTSNETKVNTKLDPLIAGELEEETSSVRSTPRELAFTSPPILHTIHTETVKMRHYNSNDNEDVSMSLGKTKLDWLDESYEEEVKLEMNGTATTEANTEATSSSQATTEYIDEITKRPRSRKVADVSGFSKELLDEAINNTSTEEVIYKKDMELLNSLDYGTGKTDVDASDSKESLSDDKYSGDGFSAYFNN